MKKRLYFRCRAVIAFSAALILALMPLLKGLHLTLSSPHSHNICMTAHDGAKSCGCTSPETHDCRHGSFLKSTSKAHADTHDPETCPFCIQVAQLLKGHFVTASQSIPFIIGHFSEEPVAFSGRVINLRFNNINPRAPPLSLSVK